MGIHIDLYVYMWKSFEGTIMYDYGADNVIADFQ